MELEITFFLGEREPVTLTIPDNATVLNLRDALPDTKDMLFMVNGLVRKDNFRIAPTDKIVLMPVLIGG